MIKIASLVLDFYDDRTFKVARKLPAEMHDLQALEASKVAELADCDFGAILQTVDGDTLRRWPLAGGDNLKLSEAYFNEVRDSLPTALVTAVETKIAQYREGNTKSVNYLDLSKLTAKTAASTGDKVWGLTVGDRHYFPLHDEHLVKLAAARFIETTDQLPLGHRFQYGRALIKQASALGVPVDPSCEAWLYGSDEINREALRMALQQRKEAAFHLGNVSLDLLEQLKEASGIVDVPPDAHPDARLVAEKTAASRPTLPAADVIAVLEQFDKTAGLGVFHYRHGMLDPYAACFKAAAYGGDPLLVDGVDLGAIDLNELKGTLSPQFVDQFMQDPVRVYRSLPDPVRELVRSLADTGPGRETVASDTHPTAVSGGDPMFRLSPGFADHASAIS